MNTRVQELFQIFCDYLWSPRIYFISFLVFFRNQNAEKFPPPYLKISTKIPEQLEIQYEQIKFSQKASFF